MKQIYLSILLIIGLVYTSQAQTNSISGNPYAKSIFFELLVSASAII